MRDDINVFEDKADLLSLIYIVNYTYQLVEVMKDLALDVTLYCLFEIIWQ